MNYLNYWILNKKKLSECWTISILSFVMNYQGKYEYASRNIHCPGINVHHSEVEDIVSENKVIKWGYEIQILTLKDFSMVKFFMDYANSKQIREMKSLHNAIFLSSQRFFYLFILRYPPPPLKENQKRFSNKR